MAESRPSLTAADVYALEGRCDITCVRWPADLPEEPTRCGACAGCAAARALFQLWTAVQPAAGVVAEAVAEVAGAGCDEASRIGWRAAVLHGDAVVWTGGLHHSRDQAAEEARLHLGVGA